MNVTNRWKTFKDFTKLVKSGCEEGWPTTGEPPIVLFSFQSQYLSMTISQVFASVYNVVTLTRKKVFSPPLTFFCTLRWLKEDRDAVIIYLLVGSSNNLLFTDNSWTVITEWHMCKRKKLMRRNNEPIKRVRKMFSWRSLLTSSRWTVISLTTPLPLHSF